MSEPNLSLEQISFMSLHHGVIERAIIETKKGNLQPLNEFIKSKHFLDLFGDMLWDDVLDRYESSWGYDNTLRIKLHEQLQTDIATGKVQLPSDFPKMQAADEDTDNDKPDLVVLKHLQSKK